MPEPETVELLRRAEKLKVALGRDRVTLVARSEYGQMVYLHTDPARAVPLASISGFVVIGVTAAAVVAFLGAVLTGSVAVAVLLAVPLLLLGVLLRPAVALDSPARLFGAFARMRRIENEENSPPEEE